MKKKLYLGGEEIKKERLLPDDLVSFFRGFLRYLRRGWTKK